MSSFKRLLDFLRKRLPKLNVYFVDVFYHKYKKKTFEENLYTEFYKGNKYWNFLRFFFLNFHLEFLRVFQDISPGLKKKMSQKNSSEITSTKSVDCIMKNRISFIRNYLQLSIIYNTPKILRMIPPRFIRENFRHNFSWKFLKKFLRSWKYFIIFQKSSTGRK